MIALDTSALLKRYREEQHSGWVEKQMSLDSEWWSSTLIAAETAIAIARTGQPVEQLTQTDARISRDLEFFDMVPVDAECITAAIELSRGFGLRTLDAIHLAAFRMMPGDCRLITFDNRLAGAAEDLGLELLTPA